MSINITALNDWHLLLSDKVVFITGGAGWIARHIARSCFNHGARLVLADINLDMINQVKDEVFGSQNTDDRILMVQLDLRNEESIKKAVEVTLNKWNKINILVNKYVKNSAIVVVYIIFLFITSAAVFTLGYVEDVSADAWSHVMGVNVRGYALMVKHISPLLKGQHGGSIINLASTGGLIAHSMFLPYSTSKGAIIQMTRNLALDLGSFNIRVNAISPGAIDSPTLYRTAAEQGLSKEDFDKINGGKCIQRLAHPQEIANMVVFLASDLCPFITGSNIVIDGGYTTV